MQKHVGSLGRIFSNATKSVRKFAEFVDLSAGVKGRSGITRARDGGMETGGGDASEMGR